MMEIRGAALTLMVEDLDRSIGFYVGTLGFEVEYRADPHFAMVRGAGVRIGLHPRGENPSAGAGGGVSLGLEVADIRAVVALLQERGVEFPLGVVDDGGAILRADFADPDGFGLYLVQTGATTA